MENQQLDRTARAQVDRSASVRVVETRTTMVTREVGTLPESYKQREATLPQGKKS